MKLILSILIIATAIFTSCSSSKKATIYYCVEPFEEQEIKLFLKKDSTFSFQDYTGCNQFEFIGNYKKAKDSISSYFLFDSVKLQYLNRKINYDRIFQIQNNDTVRIINDERIALGKKPFKLTKNSKINLQRIRYKKLKEYNIDMLGKKGYLKVFGDGNKRKAKKNLLDCQLPSFYDVIIEEK